MAAAKYVDTVRHAMLIGASLAARDDEDAQDGAQDGALAYLELQARGVLPIKLGWLLAAIKGSEKGAPRRSHPLRYFSQASQAEQLPEWAQ